MEPVPVPQAELTISPGEERFERIRKGVGLWLGPIVFIAIWFTPFENLTPQAHRLASVLSLVVIYWICEPIPIPVTALLGPSLCVLLGIAPAGPLLASFAEPIIFVFIGSFLIAQAVMAQGLDRRIALTILSMKWVGSSTRRVVFAFGAIACILSMWLSNTATVAMLLPIALGILAVMGDLMESQTGRRAEIRNMRMSRGLLLMTAYAASVGGIATPIGTPPNLIGIAMIREQLATDITFAGWMKFALPITIVMFFLLYVLIVLLHPPEVRQLEGMEEYLRSRRLALGGWTRGQINALVGFGVAVVLWVAPGILTALGALVPGIFGEYDPVAWFKQRLPEGVVAILAASLLFFLPVNFKKREFTLNWEQAARIDWGTVLLFGGGIAMGGLADSTGLAKTMGASIFDLTGVTSAAAITLFAILVGILISETASNTASATMVIPVAIAVAKAADVDPVIPAIGACLGASFGFMFPVSTPPNAVVYGSGMIPMPSMVKSGAFVGLVGLGVLWCSLRILAMFS